MSMRRKISAWVILFILCCYSGFAQQRDIHFTIVEPPKEPMLAGILAITQDPQGFLWLGGNGLYKYDGHKYTIYLHDPNKSNSLAVNRVETVFADRDGIIWIGTFGAGLDRFDPLSNMFTHYRHQSNDPGSLVEDRVIAIVRDREGTLWVGTMGGLEKFDPKTGKFKHFVHNRNDQSSLSNNQVRAIYEDRSGTIWVGTGSPFQGETPKGESGFEGGLNKLDKKTGRFIHYMHQADNMHTLIDNRVRAIFEDSHGTFWVGTAGDGLHTMDRKTGTFERHLYDPAHPEKLSRPPLKRALPYADDHIVFINEDNFGRIWIGSFENGINVYDPLTKKTTWYGHGSKDTEKIARNEFWSSYKSREGIIWIVPWQVNELYKISPYQNKVPYVKLGKQVFSFMEDSAGTLWMGTDKGLANRGNNTILQPFTTDQNDSPEKNVILFVERDGENKLWLVTNFRGLCRFDPVSKAFTMYRHQTGNSNSLLSDSVLSIKKGAAGKLWVGTKLGLDLMDIKNGTFKHFLNKINDTINFSNTLNLSNKSVQAIETDKNNNVWLGTPFGVEKLNQKTGNFKRYLRNVYVSSLLHDSRDNLWAATNNGLYKYDKSTDKFSVFALGALAVFGPTEDHEKNLWLVTELGIAKLNLQNNETNSYGISQGVNPIALTSPGYTRRNGEILFSASSGYFVIEPLQLIHRTPAPNIIINRLFLADKPVNPVPGGVLPKPMEYIKEMRLNHNQNTFSFGFTNIDFIRAPEDIRSFYMLEGYDSKWRKAASYETENYYNVPPGDYIFKVKSINTDGQITEKHIGVIISPPWWQTWWAYTLFILLFAGSVWGFIYYRSLSLLKEKRILEQKVHARTEEVMQQKEEIEAQRDSLEEQRNNLEKTLIELKTAQNQLIQSEKMASLGELTAGIAHEIQNPLNFVNNFSEVNIELLYEMTQELDKGETEEAKAIAEDVKQNLEKIRHHGQRADSIVKGMLQHSRASTGTKEPTDINALAYDYLRLAYYGFRSKDKSFNAELVTHFDPHLPKVTVIPQDIGRVLLNLFTNAFYATQQKQKTADENYKPIVEVSITIIKSFIEIMVKDNGTGIPDEIKAKIMQPFFTTKPAGEGTGLGLSLSYDIVVKGHGGQINIESADNQYSTFIIKLPL